MRSQFGRLWVYLLSYVVLKAVRPKEWACEGQVLKFSIGRSSALWLQIRVAIDLVPDLGVLGGVLASYGGCRRFQPREKPFQCYDPGLGLRVC